MAEKMKLAIIHKIVIWLLFGILLSGSVAGMWKSRHINLFDFYDTGETYRINTVDLSTMKLKGASYDGETGCITIESNDAKITFAKTNMPVQFYYLYLNIEELNNEFIPFKICCYNENAQRIVSQRELFGNGTNIYSLPENGAFTTLKFIFHGQEGARFRMNQIELRQQMNVISIKEFFKLSSILFFIYVGITVVIRIVFRKKAIHIYAVKEKCEKKIPDFMKALQFIFLLEEKPAQWICKKIPLRIRPYLRILLIILICLYADWMQKAGLYDLRKYYKYHMLIMVVCILLISWLLYNRPLQYKKWNNSVVISWFIYCIAICFSDAVMGSIFLLTGYIMLLCFGSLYFFMWNSENSNTILQETIFAVGIVFVIKMIALLGNLAMGVAIKEIFDIPSWSEYIISWKTYFFDFNLFGHSTQASNMGQNVCTHNSLVTLMYRYGVFIVIPYIMLYMECIAQALLNFIREKTVNARIILYFEVLYGIMILISNQENPFLSPLWLLQNVIIGYFFNVNRR